MKTIQKQSHPSDLPPESSGHGIGGALRQIQWTIFFLAVFFGMGFGAVFHVKPYLQSVTDTSIYVCWESDTASVGTVRSGTSSVYGNTVTESTAKTVHKIRLGGLKAGTQYFYEASQTGSSSAGFFTTAPAGNAAFRFGVWGDSQWDNPNSASSFQMLNTQMRAANLSFAASTGDFVQQGGGVNRVKYKREFFDPCSSLLKSVPIFTALGNHEYEGEPNYLTTSCIPLSYDSYMVNPYPGTNQFYYSFNYANCHFIFLNSNYGAQPVRAGSAQYNWLQQDLASPASRNANFRFVFFHHSPWCWDWWGGDLNTRSSFVPLLDNGNVDFVFSGHYHCYQRGVKTLASGHKTYYIVTGGGGGAFTDTINYKGQGGYNVYDGVPASEPNMQVHSWNNHFCRLDVDGQGVHFKAIKKDGTTLDSFDVVRTGVADTYPPVISNAGPSGNLDSMRVNLTLSSNEPARVRWSKVNQGYAQMPAANQFTTGEKGLLHSTPVTADPGINIFYLSATDTLGNSMPGAIAVQFTVSTKIGILAPKGSSEHGLSMEISAGTKGEKVAVHFRIGKPAANARLHLYSVDGKTLAKLQKTEMEAGSQILSVNPVWAGKAYSGALIAELTVDNERVVEKAILLK